MFTPNGIFRRLNKVRQSSHEMNVPQFKCIRFNAQLEDQSSHGCLLHSLEVIGWVHLLWSRSRMWTTCISKVSWECNLRRCSLCQQKLILWIVEEDREGSMKKSFVNVFHEMTVSFRSSSNDSIFVINDWTIFLSHGGHLFRVFVLKNLHLLLLSWSRCWCWSLSLGHHDGSQGFNILTMSLKRSCLQERRREENSKRWWQHFDFVLICFDRLFLSFLVMFLFGSWMK